MMKCGSTVCRMMVRHDIHLFTLFTCLHILEDLALIRTTVQNAVESAGFDGIKVYGMNRFLIDQFLVVAGMSAKERASGRYLNMLVAYNIYPVTYSIFNIFKSYLVILKKISCLLIARSQQQLQRSCLNCTRSCIELVRSLLYYIILVLIAPDHP